MKVTSSIATRDLPRRVRNRWVNRRPRGALDVTRAVVRDGDHIWVTADFPSDGGFAAIDRAGGRTTFSARVAAGRATASLAVAELPGEDERSFRLVFMGDAERPLHDPGTNPPPTRPPVSSVGPWRFDVERGRLGLQVRRERVPEFVPVRVLGIDDDRIVVGWDAGAGDDLRAVGGGVEIPLPTEVDGDRATARLGLDTDWPGDAQLTLHVGSVPLGRAGHDLRRPSLAVLLPEVEAATARLRFLWSPDGLLAVQRRGSK